MKTELVNTLYKSPLSPNYRNLTPTSNKLNQQQRGYTAERVNRLDQQYPNQSSLITQTPKSRPLTSQWSQNPKYDYHNKVHLEILEQGIL